MRNDEGVQFRLTGQEIRVLCLVDNDHYAPLVWNLLSIRFLDVFVYCVFVFVCLDEKD